ncbi:MAG: tetratricopeptide repeat protein [Gemmataceae bacterium]|nr:tetratricopeptide repeat protein [Gemmataceae bacterium]
MRPSWISLAMTIGLLAANFAQGGVYITTEPAPGPEVGKDGVRPLPFLLFLDELSGLMDIRDTLKNAKVRQHYLEQVKKLGAEADANPRAVDATMNLGGYLIRLGEYNEAIQRLLPLARDAGRENFMVSANLGTAYLMIGELRSAADYLDQALRALQRHPPKGVSKERLDWYRRVEEAQLKLVRLRLAEQSKAGGKPPPIETVDDLLGVRFVGDDGSYQAGGIAAAQKEKLKDARPLVQQLVLWTPDDGRLYWLLGEVLNAEGDMKDAKTVLDQCSDSRRMNAAELRDHRRVLDTALAQAPPKDTGASWMPDREHLILVGSGLGVIVLFLVYWQGRELRRRRRTAS